MTKSTHIIFASCLFVISAFPFSGLYCLWGPRSSYFKATFFFGVMALALVNISLGVLILKKKVALAHIYVGCLTLMPLFFAYDFVDLTLEQHENDFLLNLISIVGIIEGSVSLSVLVFLHCLGSDKVKYIEFSFKSIAIVWCCAWICLALRRKQKKQESVSSSVAKFIKPPSCVPDTFICSICLENRGKEKKEDLALLHDCTHTFHKQCLMKWLESQPNCPICRNPLNDQEHN